MRALVFGRYHRIVVFSLLLVLSGTVLLTGGAAASHSAEASGNITGTVTDEANQTIPGAIVNVTGYGTHLKATTDATGDYELTDVPYETQTVEVVHPDYEDNSRSVAVSTTNSPVTEDFDLERTTGNITGTVNSTRSRIGDRISGVGVSIEHDNGMDQTLIERGVGGMESETDTNDNGVYTVEVPTGEVQITFERDGFETVERTVTVGAGSTVTEDIDLDAILMNVSGTVTNENGDAITGADVSVDVSDPSIWTLTPVQTDSNGEYRIDDVPGHYQGSTTRTVSADAQNFQADSEPVSISDSDVQQNFSLQQNAGNFQLTVDDDEGYRLHNISVDIEGVDQTQTTTGTDGTYTENLSFGTHTVTVSHPDYETEEFTTEIRQGSTTTRSVSIGRTEPLDFSIDRVTPDFWQSGDQVTVEFSFNEDVYSTVDLTVSGPETNPQTIETRRFSTGFDSDYDGEYTFEVPPEGQLNDGSYTIELSALNRTTSQSVDVSNVFDSSQVEFSETNYQSPAGDFVEVSVTIGDLDEAYIMIGGDREADESELQNYLDVLHVSGDATFIVNTRLIGTDRDSEDVYIPIEGEVTSYAQSIGAASQPNGTFDEVSFQDENGNEIASTLAEFRNEVGLSPRGNPLEIGRYRLVAGASGTVVERSDGIPEFRQPVARSNLVLTPPEIGDVTTYTLPPAAADRVDQFENNEEPAEIGDIGSLLDVATETNRVARGDRILIEVQAVGLYGALFDDGASDNAAINPDTDGNGSVPLNRIKTLLDNHEGVHMELATSRFADPNNPGSTLQFENVDSSDLYVLPDDSADQWDDPETVGDDPIVGGFYILINTRGNDPFDNQPRDGDELTFEFAYESPEDERYQYPDYSFGNPPAPFDPAVEPVDGIEHFPYFGSRATTVSVNDSFVFEDPSVDYSETTLDGELIVPAEQGGVISGQTNIAPGSQVELQLIASNRPSPQTITIEEVEISEDRTFEVTEDFSEFEPGERVEVEFYSQGRLIENRLVDKRGVRVVDNLDNPATFEITEFTEAVEVERGQRLGEISATITNTGDIADRQAINFTIDGQNVREQPATLYSDEAATLNLSDEFVVLSPGEYSYTVSTDDDERTGTLTVTASEDTRINSVESDNATLNSLPEGTENQNQNQDGPDDTDGSGLFSLVGLRGRDVAVAAAVTGAMHVLGQWT